jgi:hypothetical protein
VTRAVLLADFATYWQSVRLNLKRSAEGWGLGQELHFYGEAAEGFGDDDGE